ncbi:hypothetical protein [Streptomyces lunaelactis]|uniref:hypothetical protein n=1 Tax=Streptomyces lunaelactis TaxID=1535768 RepID=UPI001FE3821A|nr:hypothetical protein [Streptomyces lunaelactis]
MVIATMRGFVADKQVTVHNRTGTPLIVRPHAERRGKAFWVSALTTTHPRLPARNLRRPWKSGG